jgi:two-component system, LytTR family, sensor kinase
MKTETNLFKPFTFGQFIIANLLISFSVLALFFKNSFESVNYFLIGFIWAFAITSTQWLGPVLINYFLDKRMKWMNRPVTRTFIQIISLLLWSVLAYIAVQSVMYYFIRGLTPDRSWEYIRVSILLTFLIALFLSVLFTAVGFFKAWRQSVLNEAELQSRMLAYKYESLRNQLNPHFLFNSLNVLADLVYTDQEQAVKFIRQLSDLFQYVLDSRDKELVTLKEEMQFLNAYMYLLNTRFGDKLKVNISIDENTEGYVVPMSLQLLVENAVKHNEVSEKNPLKVFISNENGFLRVENVKKPRIAGEISKNTGLKNISLQYNHLSEKDIEVIETGNTFSVRIPLIKEEEHERTDH